MRMNDKQWV
jgi:hypothetical protein